MRWVLTWKYTEGGDWKAKARLVILGYQHPELTSVPTAVPTPGTMSRHLLLQACALHKTSDPLWFPQLTCKHLPLQELTIKAPPEVGCLFSDSEGKTCSICAFVEIVQWTHISTPCVVVGYHTETFSAWVETHVD